MLTAVNAAAAKRFIRADENFAVCLALAVFNASRVDSVGLIGFCMLILLISITVFAGIATGRDRMYTIPPIRADLRPVLKTV